MNEFFKKLMTIEVNQQKTQKKN